MNEREIKLLSDLEKKWHISYSEYCTKVNSIENNIDNVLKKIDSYINLINVLKLTMNKSAIEIHDSLNSFDDKNSIPYQKDLVQENAIAHHRQAPISTKNELKYFNPKTTINISDKKEKAIKPTRIYNGEKRKKGELPLYIEKWCEEEKIAQDNDINKRNEQLNTYNLYLEITNLYYNVLYQLNDTIENVIIEELRGIKAFLYAQGIMEAVLSGELPSMSRPAKISRFQRSNAYKRYFLFVKNTVDFYTLLISIYQNDYLTRLFNRGDKNLVTADFNKFSTPIENLKKTSSFGGQNG